MTRICLAYLDDVIVYLRHYSQHLRDLRAVFERLRVAGLKLKPSKCQLFRNEILYHGHVANAAGVSPDPAKLFVLSTWPVPETVCDVQSFVGFINFYGEFIPNSTHLTAPLYYLTVGKKGTDKMPLKADDLAAFQSLKRSLCSSPQLSHPDLSKQFVVHTDASKFAVCAVLLKRTDDGIEHPISFLSKKLLSPQQNYSTFERECLAIVAAVTHFLIYLLARPFVLRTDHKALTWLFCKNPKPARALVAGLRRCSNTRSSWSISRAPKTQLPTCYCASQVRPSIKSCRLSSLAALSGLRSPPQTPIALIYGLTG